MAAMLEAVRQRLCRPQPGRARAPGGITAADDLAGVAHDSPGTCPLAALPLRSRRRIGSYWPVLPPDETVQRKSNLAASLFHPRGDDTAAGGTLFLRLRPVAPASGGVVDRLPQPVWLRPPIVATEQDPVCRHHNLSNHHDVLPPARASDYARIGASGSLCLDLCHVLETEQAPGYSQRGEASQLMTDSPRSNPPASALATRAVAAILVTTFALAIFAANPTGDFPLNDDWNYGASVKILLDQGRLVVTCWTLASALTQIFAGAAWSSLTGFSFDGLRCLTLATATLSILLTIPLVNCLTRERACGLVAAAMLVANPLFFAMATTFMTDVPFLCLALAATLSLVNLSKKSGLPELVLSCALTVLVVLTRQVGIVIPLAYLASAWARGSRATQWATNLAPAATGLATITLYQLWLSATQTHMFSYRAEQAYLAAILSSGAVAVATHFLLNVFRAFMYIGLSVLPGYLRLAPAIWENLSGKERPFFLLLAGELLVLVFAGLVFCGQSMPLADNVLVDFGLGPIFAGGDATLILRHWAHQSKAVWLAITLGAVTGMALVAATLTIVALRLRQQSKELASTDSSRSIVVFYLLIVIMYLAVDCWRGFFDRYMVFVAPYVMALAAWLCQGSLSARFARGARRLVAIGCAVSASLIWCAYLWFCINASHDYFSFNRARWQGLTYLTETLQVSPLRIDGGLEFNGWQAYIGKDSGPAAVVFDPGMKHGHEFLVTNYAAPGYRILKTIPFARRLTSQPGTVYVLQTAMAN